MRPYRLSSRLIAPSAPDELTDAQLDTLLALDAATQGGETGSVRHWIISEARAAGAPISWQRRRRLDRGTAVVLGALERLGLVYATYWKHTGAPYDHFTKWEISQAGRALLGGPNAQAS